MSRLKSESMLRFWSDLLADFPRCCVMTPNHDVLYLDFEILTDIGSFPFSIETADQYLHLQDGDIVISNDPYSGGTVLSSPTLILGVGQRSQKGQIPAELLVAVRMTLMPRVGPFKTVDEEGLRIPPSPLASGEEINEALLDALNSHPQAPGHLVSTLRQTVAKLFKLRKEIKRWMAAGQIDLSRNVIKQYLQHTQSRFTSLIEDYREGDALMEYGLSKNEMLKLKTELHNGRLSFDFSGTSPGQHLFFTPSATVGVCVGASLACLPHRVPINSGVLNCFDVKTPRGSLVHSSFPQPLQMGHTDGVNLMAHTVVQSLAKIDERFLTAGSGYSHCHFEFMFDNKMHYISALAVGIGATAKGPGVAGAEIWRRFQRDWSLETIEKNLPFKIASYGRRTNSGGHGKYPGGDGMAKTILVQAPGQFSWFFLEPEHKPIGVQGGKTALGPAVIVNRGGTAKEELPWRGSVRVNPGDEIILLSCGGGGFGA